MKTKKEILKMNRQELINYKWSDDLEMKNSYCSDCSNCSNCSNCSFCSNCSDCSYCRNIKTTSKYMICNVQLTKKQYEKKMKDLE